MEQKAMKRSKGSAQNALARATSFGAGSRFPPIPAPQMAESTETKYRCKECHRHEWRERVFVAEKAP